jgi:hypothetical protein
MHTKCWFESLIGREYLKDQGVHERIILKWILEKCGWMGGGGYSKYGNKPSGSINCSLFLDEISDYKL